jgi:hypothetical protein
MHSLQPVLFALSDRINRVSRFFETIILQAGRHNLEEYAIINERTCHFLTCCHRYIAASDIIVKRAMDYTCRLIQPRTSNINDFSKSMFIADARATEFWEFMSLCAVFYSAESNI